MVISLYVQLDSKFISCQLTREPWWISSQRDEMERQRNEELQRYLPQEPVATSPIMSQPIPNSMESELSELSESDADSDIDNSSDEDRSVRCGLEHGDYDGVCPIRLRGEQVAIRKLAQSLLPDPTRILTKKELNSTRIACKSLYVPAVVHVDTEDKLLELDQSDQAAVVVPSVVIRRPFYCRMTCSRRIYDKHSLELAQEADIVKRAIRRTLDWYSYSD